MDLISQTAVEGRPGPAFPEAYPRVDGLQFNDAKTFMHGPHVCLGKRVAQIQLEEAYRQLLVRLPDIEWTGQIDIAPNNFVHAIRKLGVRYTAKH